MLPILSANCIGNVWGKTVSLLCDCTEAWLFFHSERPQWTGAQNNSSNLRDCNNFRREKGVLVLEQVGSQRARPSSHMSLPFSRQGVMRPEVRFQPSPGWLDDLEAPCDLESFGFLNPEQRSRQLFGRTVGKIT